MDQPLRILHIFGQMNRGGAETFIMQVYRHINRDRLQFDFAVHSKQPGHYDEEIRNLGGRIFKIPQPRLNNLLSYIKALKQLLNKAGPFAAIHSHVHFFSGIPLAVASSLGIPICIAHSHNTQDGKGNSPFRKLYRKYMQQLISRHATHLLACSRPACEALYGPECWKDKRIRIIHYGIDFTPFMLLPKDRRILRKKFGFPENAYLFGHVGRFEIQKNHRFLIELFEALLAKIPTAYLVLVGEGSLKAEIEKLVYSKGIIDRVYFMGVRTDVPEIMGCLDVLLFPSLWEGLGLVLVEAQAAGIPCVVSDVIPSEVDLNIGLIKYVNLGAPKEVWINNIQECLGFVSPPIETRLYALKTLGFDVMDSVYFLQQIYGVI